VGQIGRDAELFRAPVAQVLQERNQGFAGGAKRISDLWRRGGDCGSAYNAIFFQFTELRGKNLFADASQKIAEFGEAQRAKRKAPDRLDFPLAAQDVDGRLNGAAVANFHGGSELTNLCVLHRRKVSLYHAMETFGSHKSA
jgi:hypothetical protein